jgi:hypothetical protein
MVSDISIVDTNAMELHEYAGTWGAGTLVPGKLREEISFDYGRYDKVRIIINNTSIPKEGLDNSSEVVRSDGHETQSAICLFFQNLPNNLLNVDCIYVAVSIDIGSWIRDQAQCRIHTDLYIFCIDNAIFINVLGQGR